MGKIAIRTDTGKNRLYIRISGFFSGADLEPTLAKIRAELEHTRPDFDVITDIKGFVPGSPKAAEAIKVGGELVKAGGRRRAVRVTGGLVTGLMQFKRMLGNVFEEDETVRYAGSIEEADQILDQW